MTTFKSRLFKVLEDEAINYVRKSLKETTKSIPKDDDALTALVSLGYDKLSAQRALESVSSSLSTENRVKSALKNL